MIVVRGTYASAYRPAARPGWDRLAYGVVVGFLVGAVLFGLGIVHADEDGGRYTPSSRGPRASYQTDQVQRWYEAVDAYAWPTETALLVIACESQGDPGAVNRSSGAAGLFQLYGWSWLAERLTGIRNVLTPWVNIRTAFELWRETGSFSWHWYASIGCWG